MRDFVCACIVMAVAWAAGASALGLPEADAAAPDDTDGQVAAGQDARAALLEKVRRLKAEHGEVVKPMLAERYRQVDCPNRGVVSRMLGPEGQVVPLEASAREWLLATGEELLRKGEPDWELLGAVQSCFCFEPPTGHVVRLMQHVLSKPVATTNVTAIGSQHLESIDVAMFVLSRQGTDEALATLKALALLPMQDSAGVLPGENGAPLSPVLKDMFSSTACRLVVHEAPKNRVLPFMKEVASHFEAAAAAGRSVESREV
ncbi:MAG: hypothetical protein JXR94_05730, partial [Candidatus Hydrogenedentes bacterium]|nr:hypothetical protein [Candidatus Hydrogenedentota bacterium]